MKTIYKGFQGNCPICNKEVLLYFSTQDKEYAPEDMRVHNCSCGLSFFYNFEVKVTCTVYDSMITGVRNTEEIELAS